MQDFMRLGYRHCVGLMVVNNNGNIFTGQRLGYGSSAWQMPQGGIEKGEEASVAAYRELEEETSITFSHVELLAVSKNWLSYDLPADLIPKLWKGSFRGQTQKWFLMKFVGDDTEINLKTAVPEFSSWRWSTRQQLVSSIVEFKKDLYENVLEEFGSFF